MINIRKTAIATLALIGSLSLVPKVALAASDQTGIKSVGFASGSWGRALWAVGSNGKPYYAYVSGGGAGCTPQSLDDVKLWQSQLMAAYLSGKQVQIDYNSGTCGNLLTSVNDI
jgi:ABC-type glycerol-3-phosphate transport system substrate-binding protein